MNAMRSAVGILFVVLASKTCTLAMAQDVEQPSEASICQAIRLSVNAQAPATRRDGSARPTAIYGAVNHEVAGRWSRRMLSSLL